MAADRNADHLVRDRRLARRCPLALRTRPDRDHIAVVTTFGRQSRAMVTP